VREWILDRFESYGQHVVVAALFLTPMAFNLASKDIFNLTKLTVLWVLGIVLLWIWFTWSNERGVWIPRFRLGYAALAFLAAYAVAAIFSHAPAVSLVGVYGRYGGVIPFFLYGAIMLVIVGMFWEHPEKLRTIPRIITWASGLMGAYVLIQASGTDWLPWGSGGGIGSIGTMGNSNFSGGYLGIGVPFFLYMALTAKGRITKRVVQAAFVGDLVAIWFTGARGGLVAAILGVATIALAYRHRLPKWIRVSVAVAITVASIVFVLALVHPGSKRPPAPLAKAQVLDPKTLRDRVWYWTAAGRIFAEHPIVGTGPDTYYSQYTRYRLPQDGAELGLTITDKPHNIYFEYAANSGILGLGTYLGFVGLAIFYGFARLRRLEEPERFLLVAFLAFLIAYLSQGFFSIDVPPLAVMGWVGIGGIAALADPVILAEREKRLARKPPKWTKKSRRNNKPGEQERSSYVAAGSSGNRPWLLAASSATALGLIVMGLRPIAADMHAKSGETAIRRGRVQVATSEITQARRLNPFEGNYWTLAADFAQQTGESTPNLAKKEAGLRLAIEAYNRALKIKPNDPLAGVAAVSTYTELSMLEKAHFRTTDRIWRRVLSRDPTDWALRDHYTQFLVLWAESSGSRLPRQKAVEQLLVAVGRQPKVIGNWLNLGQNYLKLGMTEKGRAAIRRALQIDPNNQPAKDLLDLPKSKVA